MVPYSTWANDEIASCPWCHHPRLSEDGVCLPTLPLRNNWLMAVPWWLLGSIKHHLFSAHKNTKNKNLPWFLWHLILMKSTKTKENSGDFSTGWKQRQNPQTQGTYCVPFTANIVVWQTRSWCAASTRANRKLVSETAQLFISIDKSLISETRDDTRVDVTSRCMG